MAGPVEAWGHRYNLALEFKVFKGLVRWPGKSQSSWPRCLRGWLGPGSLRRLSPKVPLSPELQPSSPGTANTFSEPDSAVRKRVWAVRAALLIRGAGPGHTVGGVGARPLDCSWELLLGSKEVRIAGEKRGERCRVCFCTQLKLILFFCLPPPFSLFL